MLYWGMDSVAINLYLNFWWNGAVDIEKYLSYFGIKYFSWVVFNLLKICNTLMEKNQITKFWRKGSKFCYYLVM